jgi:hypothetical protein
VDSTDIGQSGNTAAVSNIGENDLDREAARQHCLLLAKGDPNERFVFQAFADRPEDRGDKSLIGTRCGTFDEVAGWLEEMNGRKAGIFLTVNKTSGAGRTDGDIIGVRAYFYDHDEKDGPMRADSPLPGSLIVRSGHGSHCYYLLEQVASPAAFTVIQTAIASQLGTDSKVTDRPRVMRLAGSVNWKFEPVPVVIVEAHPERTYTVEQVATAFGVDPASLSSGSPPHRAKPKIPTDPTADHQAIRAGCAWFNGLFINPQDADEQHWFAGLRVVACCVDAETVGQEMSGGHKDYTEAETSAKLARAQGYEPLTCSIINNKLGFAGCDACPHRWRIKSPIDLGRDKGDDADTAKQFALGKVVALEAGRAADFQKKETFEALAKLDQDDRDELMIRVRAAIAANRRLGLSRKDVDQRLNAEIRARMRAQQQQTRGGLPLIIVSDTQLRDVADQAMSALATANANAPVDFIRCGRLVRIIVSLENGRPKVQEHSERTLPGRMSRVADFQRQGMTQLIGCSPPGDLVTELLNRTDYPDLPRLAGVTTMPIARSDGSFHTIPGYDPDTGIFLAPIGDPMEFTNTEAPTEADVKNAVQALRFVFIDYPFVGEAGFAHVVAFLLTLLLRPLFKDCVPFFLFRATSQGTGKSMIVELGGIIVYGYESLSPFSPTDDDAEMRKRLTTALMEARPIIFLDNASGRLSSDALAVLGTASEWSDRILGGNTSADLPNQTVVAITGNNLVVDDDLFRRIVLVQLHSQHEHPQERTDFQVPRLKAFAREHRHELLAALLILVRNYHAKGKPVPVDLKPYGSFEVWNETIGGILHAAGISGFRHDADLMSDLNDGMKVQWGGFLRALYLWSWDDPFTIAAVIEQIPDPRRDHGSRGFPLLAEALPTELAARRDRGQGTLNHSLGQTFKTMANTVVKGFAIERAGDDPANHAALWRVRCIDSKHLPDTTQMALAMVNVFEAAGLWADRPNRKRLDTSMFRSAVNTAAQSSLICSAHALPARDAPNYTSVISFWVTLFVSVFSSDPNQQQQLKNDLVARILATPQAG